MNVLVTALAVGLGVASSVVGAKARSHTVTIEGMAFVPARLDVAAGDTVVWVNKDLVAHSATVAGSFDSGSIGSGKSWSYVMRVKGELAYLCTFHPTMKAVVRVK